MKSAYNIIMILALVLLTNLNCNAGNIVIKNNEAEKLIIFGNSKIMLDLDYNNKCNISSLIVNNQKVISGPEGIFTEITSPTNNYSSLKLSESPKVKIGKNQISIENIILGSDKEKVIENWKFLITEEDINFEIERNIPNSFLVNETAFPSFNFDNINTWDGAFQSYGGIAWFYLFNQRLCTYGVHSDNSIFWNSETGNGLKVSVSAPEKQIAMKYSRSNEDKLIYNITISDNELSYRYEKEKRSRFIRGKTDVWDSFKISKGKYVQNINLSFVDYNKEYDRGNLIGINGQAVTNLLNTVARIGVIDKKLFGGNSWHTPYGPICLHEQYIADFAIGINDESYINGYKECLNFYKDNAIQNDGRVIARWAYLDEDAIPGTVTDKGFYEAQWGYLLDSNPDFVANVSELFNISGDLKWVSNFKTSCEKALDYMIKRDSNKNHLVEMMTDSQSERRGSDWIDIIWASYENAFVNAKLCYALTLWSEVEKQLNDNPKSKYYSSYAEGLKVSFNKSTDKGGFWDERNKWFVHWREKDNTIHGNNLVMPVNLMAVAYNICDDSTRIKFVLDKIEEQTSHENLFFWPICLYPYAVGEGNDWQFPFPNYENGDLFLSWGSVGVEAYANYKPEIALKYIENILAQYEKDGLAFQRYGRVNQNGLGDDILAGNSLAIVGLYKSIYGIYPQYNRLYLNPHLPKKLSGTELFYNFRNDKLQIELSTNNYSISNSQFKISDHNDFGFYSAYNELTYFKGNESNFSLKLNTSNKVSIENVKWESNNYSWTQNLLEKNSDEISYEINNLEPEKYFTIFINNKNFQQVKSNRTGSLKFSIETSNNEENILITIQN